MSGSRRPGFPLTAASMVIMPELGGQAPPGLGGHGQEGTQNLMCAQAAAVLAGLAVVAAWPRALAADPVIAPGIAAWPAWKGRQAWRGARCCQGCAAEPPPATRV